MAGEHRQDRKRTDRSFLAGLACISKTLARCSPGNRTEAVGTAGFFGRFPHTPEHWPGEPVRQYWEVWSGQGAWLWEASFSITSGPQPASPLSYCVSSDRWLLSGLCPGLLHRPVKPFRTELVRRSPE